MTVTRAEKALRYLLAPMAVQPPADLLLAPLDGPPRTLAAWLTNFHLVLFVIDPFTNESAWLLDTDARIMRNFRGADCRVAWLVTADAAGATQFLGPLAREFLVFTDPDRAVVKALGLRNLPAVAWLKTDLSLGGAAEGWNPAAWRELTESLGDVMSWARPQVPDRGDPAPFAGTAAVR